ncbi:putative heterokaryon incompatibility protein [Aaosphaeria arxii CBS 175.79]|uniref:Putative heterokaryon incompatibility protein n=1 Tax=Aaosphaeria arxii CBS 175.79 TaxID=1450172 RepID=A0A6A5X875_9PLEO|nr:putative heterokaryon incompatibility protein [Aaosphaeria arxii CBS 175.79]KAF2008954.1 putative heterokaryon incompatibility protein [Aaosphaeria arxii CBS 175.79]
MITPQWDETFFNRFEDAYQTTIVLDNVSNPATNFSTVLERDVKAIDPTLILFLRRIRRLHLTVVDSNPFYHSVISKRFRRVDQTIAPGIIELIDEDTDSKLSLFKYSATAAFNGTEPRRPNVSRTDIVLAFPVAQQKPLTYTPLIREQNLVFAYLPLGNFGFKFVIHADFLTTSNRQSVDEDSSWNQNIARNIPYAFANAVSCFNADGSNVPSVHKELGKTWPLYLSTDTVGLNTYWSSIKRDIIRHLSELNVIKTRSGGLGVPKDLKFLDWAHDRHGQPILGHGSDYLSVDYPSSVREPLLSLGVTAPSWEWLCQKLYGLQNDGLLRGKMQNADWCSDLAEVILKARDWRDEIGLKQTLGKISLIPLEDGTWRCAPSEDSPIYFPASLGTTVPPGLSISLVSEKACSCPHRRLLFQKLGVKDCDAPNVVESILDYHAKCTSAAFSHMVAQVKYLYKAQEHLQSQNTISLHFVCSDKNHKKYFKRGRSSYIDVTVSGNLQRLFSGYSGAHFLDSSYFAGFDPVEKTRFTTWLSEKAEVALVPRFVSARGLHEDFEWLLNHKNDQVLAILYENQDLYMSQATDTVKDGLGKYKFLCEVEMSKQLYLAIQEHTFLPVEKEMVRKAFCDNGIVLSYNNYVSIGDCSWHGPKNHFIRPALFPVYGRELDRLFREILNVQNITAVEAEEHIQGLRDKGATIEDLTDIYVLIQEHCADTFSADDKYPCIAIPSPSGTKFEWKSPSQCVWDDEEFSQNELILESKIAIHHIIEQYAPTAVPFFTKVLEIPNAGVAELLADLKLMQEQKRDEPKRVYLLYERISNYRRGFAGMIKYIQKVQTRSRADHWDREAFQNSPLVFLRGINKQSGRWLPLEDCIWARSVLRSKHALIHSLNEYRDLFRDTLEIPNATVEMLITDLLDVSSKMTSLIHDEDGYQYVRELIQEIGRLYKDDSEVKRLVGKRCWPCRMRTGPPTLRRIGGFYVNDRQDLCDIFSDTYTILDFDLYVSRQVEGLLCSQACFQFLSESVTVETKFREPLGQDHDLKKDLQSRKGALMKYFEFVGCESPHELRPLFDNIEVWTSEDINTTYTLDEVTITKSEGGSSVEVNIGHNDMARLDIYVSANRHTRDCALLTDFPRQLIEALELEPADLPDLQVLLQVPRASLNALLIKKGIIGKASDIFEEGLRENLINGDCDDSDDHSSSEIGRGVSATSVGSITIESTRASARSEAANTTPKQHVVFRPVTNLFASRPTTREPLSQVHLDVPTDGSPRNRPVTPRLTGTGLYNVGNRSRNMQRIRHLVQQDRDSDDSVVAFDMSTCREALESVGPGPSSILVQAEPSLQGQERLASNRNGEERARDSEVGFLGEYYLTPSQVYLLLHDVFQIPNFSGEKNWTSSLRSRAGFSSFGHEVSDFTYKDTEGALTKHLSQMQPQWKYAIVPARDQEYNMSRSQDSLLHESETIRAGKIPSSHMKSEIILDNVMQAKRLRVTSAIPSEVYVILRISGLDVLEDGAPDHLWYNVYLDPYTCSESGILKFTTPTFTVTASH